MANELKRYKSFFQVFKREMERALRNKSLVYKVAIMAEGMISEFEIELKIPEKGEYYEIEDWIYYGLRMDELEIVAIKEAQIASYHSKEAQQEILKRVREANELYYQKDGVQSKSYLQGYVMVCGWSFFRNLFMTPYAGIAMNAENFSFSEIDSYRDQDVFDVGGPLDEYFHSGGLFFLEKKAHSYPIKVRLK